MEPSILMLGPGDATQPNRYVGRISYTKILFYLLLFLVPIFFPYDAILLLHCLFVTYWVFKKSV